ncbi:hypothetical protein, partial [Escherichia coli]|uniref:hypothetical protein n=1 Tax=Escherichia coli TaxID=562 RepID=UPI003CCBA14C
SETANCYCIENSLSVGYFPFSKRTPITAILSRREWSGMTSGNGWIHRLSNMNWSEGCNMMLRGSMALT